MFKFLDKVAANSFKKLVRIYLTERVEGWDRIERVFPVSTIDTAYEQAWQQFGKNSMTKHPDEYKMQAEDAADFVIQYLGTWSDINFSSSALAAH